MRATLQTKKDRANYYVVLDYIDETTGNRKLKWIATDISKTGNTKRAANERLKEILAEYEHAKIDLGKNILFIEYLKQWLKNLKPCRSQSLNHKAIKEIIPQGSVI